MSINRNSPIPYYAQVAQVLSDRIKYGNWKTGDRLPSESELCQTFAVSRPVIRQALRELMTEGLIVRHKGRGTFIAAPKIREGLFQRLSGFFQDMVDRGYTPITRVLKQEIVPASLKIATQLRIEQATPVIEIERLRSVEDEPIVWVVTFIPYSICPALVNADLSQYSLYALLEEQYGLTIARGHRTLEAVAAQDYEANLLKIPLGSPLVSLDSVSYLENGTPLEYYHALHRGDRSQFEVELIRIRDQGNVSGLLSLDGRPLPPGQKPITPTGNH